MRSRVLREGLKQAFQSQRCHLLSDLLRNWCSLSSLFSFLSSQFSSLFNSEGITHYYKVESRGFHQDIVMGVRSSIIVKSPVNNIFGKFVGVSMPIYVAGKSIPVPKGGPSSKIVTPANDTTRGGVPFVLS